MEKKRSLRSSVLKIIIMGLVMLMNVAVFGQNEVNAADFGFRFHKEITPTVTRHDGYSRDNVAENVAKEHFASSNKVILVNREKFPDAISATNISQGKYPVLYTYDDHVSDSTLKLIKSMSLDEIYVLGGTLSINESVVNELEKVTNATVTRIAGRSRYDANVEAVEENFTQANHVVVASGEVFTDALYGVSYANTIDAPIILTKTKHLESSTVDLLKRLNVSQVTIIGGPLTVTPAVETQLNTLGITHNRISGRNRYIGSAEVAEASYQTPENIVFASGEVFADALVSAPLAQKLDAPILLAEDTKIASEIEDYLMNNKLYLENIYIQGGTSTILPQTEYQITSYAKLTLDAIRIEDVTKKEFEGEVFRTRRTAENVLSLPDIVYVQSDELDYGQVQIGQEPQQGFVYKDDNGKIVREIEELDKVLILGTKGRVDEVLSKTDEEKYTLAHQIENIEFIDEDLYPENSVHGTYPYYDLTPEEHLELYNSIDYDLLNAEFGKLLNAHRESIGVDAVEYRSEFNEGSEYISQALADYGYLSPEGQPPHTLPNNGGSTIAYINQNFDTTNFHASGENLAMMYNSNNPYQIVSEKYLAEKMFEIWMASTFGHRENMENAAHDGYSFAIYPVMRGNTMTATKNINGEYGDVGYYDYSYAGDLAGVGIVGTLTLLGQ